MFKSINNQFISLKKEVIKPQKIQKLIKKFEKNPIPLPVGKIKKGDLAELDEIIGMVGLYYFEIKKCHAYNSWGQLKSSWGDIEKSSPVVERRWASHTFNDRDFFPFYIGKSLDGISKRVKEHVFAKTKKGYLKSTSALRLQQHYLDDSTAEVLNGFEFRVSTIEINIEPELLPLLESVIRKEKNCMVGRDRA